MQSRRAPHAPRPTAAGPATPSSAGMGRPTRTAYPCQLRRDTRHIARDTATSHVNSIGNSRFGAALPPFWSRVGASQQSRSSVVGSHSERRYAMKLRKINVRKAGPACLTAAACSVYGPGASNSAIFSDVWAPPRTWWRPAQVAGRVERRSHGRSSHHRHGCIAVVAPAGLRPGGRRGDHRQAGYRLLRNLSCRRCGTGSPAGRSHTIRQATDWYERRYGESVDIEDLIEALDELCFISAADEEPVEAHPPKWRRPRRSACQVLMGIRVSGRVAR